MTGLAQAADGLDPAERFLDLLAFDGADPIAGVPCRASIDRRATVGIVLRDMRRAAAFATAGDEVVNGPRNPPTFGRAKFPTWRGW